MFHNFMYFTGCCRAALVKVNYSLLCDLAEAGEGRERKLRRTKAERITGGAPLIHSSKIVEQVASASFVRLLAGIY